MAWVTRRSLHLCTMETGQISFVATAAYACSKMVGCQANMEYLLHTLSLLQKAPEWGHEREWRVIAYSCSDDSRTHYCKLMPDSVYLGIEMQEVWL